MKIDDNLSEIFEVPSSGGVIVGDVNDASIVPAEDETVEDLDYQKSRETAYTLMSKSKQILNLAVRIAEAEESSKAIDAASNALMHATQANQQLLDLALKHKQHKTPPKDEKRDPPAPTVTNNAIFVGSTADLLNIAMSKIKPD